MMSTHLELTRRGHLEKFLRVFGYLKKHHYYEMVFEPIKPSVSTKTPNLKTGLQEFMEILKNNYQKIYLSLEDWDLG